MTETLQRPAGMFEVRLYGLHASITSEQLIAFFSYGVRVQGAVLHPSPDGSQWARVWLNNEREVGICMERKSKLAENGITMTRFPSHPGLITPESSRKPIPTSTSTSTSVSFPPLMLTTQNPPINSTPGEGIKQSPPQPTTPSSPWSVVQNHNHNHNHNHHNHKFGRGFGVGAGAGAGSFSPLTSPSPRFDQSHGGLGYRHLDPSGPLPRNLYVMGLPLDLTQVQFKALFTEFGMVEHSILLSQLDSMGRRRGFVLMSTHREAVLAMNEMNGKQIEGHGVDVSWALRQREAQQIGPGVGGLGNRVLHPPTTPARREAADGFAVVVENLDPAFFPTTDRISEVFSVFGPISKVAVLSGTPIKVVVHLEHEISATALINSSGHEIGGRPITTYAYQSAPQFKLQSPISNHRPFSFDPFREESLSPVMRVSTLADSLLSPTSDPFVPVPPTHIQLPPSDRATPSSKLSSISGSSKTSDSHSHSRSTSNSQSAFAGLSLGGGGASPHRIWQ